MRHTAKVSSAQVEHPSDKSRGFMADIAGLRKLWPYLVQDKSMILAAAVLIPLISGLQMALPLLLRLTIDKGVLSGNMTNLFLGSACYLMVVIAEYLARAGQSIASSRAVLNMIRIMRMKLIDHVLDLKAAYHDRALSGALVTRATGDFDNLSESLNLGVLNSIVDVAVLLGCVIGMFLLNWQLALTAVLVLPVVTWIVQWFSKGLKSSMTLARVKIAALNGYTQECFYGHATVKLLNGEQAAIKQYNQLNTDYRDAQMESVVLDAVMFAVLDGIASITLGLVLWLIVGGVVDSAGGMGSWGSALTAGVLVAFVQYIQQLFEPLKQLGNKMAMLQGAFSSIDRIFGILDKDEKVTGQTIVRDISGKVTFDHVGFSYSANHQQIPVLKDISFVLEPGKSVALVGATGSGKSTIIKLLTKLYDGYSGTITIDDCDLKDIEPKSLRQHLAIVPQDIVLFDGTVEFNISLGTPGITREQVIKAAREIGAARFIERLPGGYDFEIREHGSNLSQGQKQLLAFARALAKNPALVVLDEATSSIDPESEAVIQEATTRLLKDRTVIVIAHRLSTIRQCDQIIVINKGQIVESGTHEKLLAANGAYFQLYSAFV